MDESTQQILALALVAGVVLLEWVRRCRKRRRGKTGCDGCDSPGKAKQRSNKETPLRFYKRR